MRRFIHLICKKNDTPDNEILEIAIKNNHILVTKDKNFYHSFLFKKQPRKLIMVKAENMRIREMKSIFEQNFDKLIQLLKYKDLVIMGIDKIDLHS